MKKTVIFLSMILCILLINGCNEETFMPDTDPNSYENPKGLLYADVLNAREYSLVKSGVPHIDTDGLIPLYTIVSVEDAEGVLLDESYTKDVSISNVNPDESPVDYSKAGIITIADANLFGPGDYYFNIEVKTQTGSKSLSTTFEKVFHLSMGPQLVEDLLYSPIAQNLVIGTGNTTTKPYILSGNLDAVFSLGTDDDKLNIDGATGVISLKEGYTPIENDTIYPLVEVTSNISGEKTQFQGDGFLMLVVSETPVVLPKKTIYFFYPTLEALNSLYGYRRYIIEPGDVTEAKTWTQTKPSTLAAGERPENVIGNKSLWTNATAGVWSAHESDIVINSQDLTKYKLGYDVSTVFYLKNQYVEYMPNGGTPTDIEIYYSTDFDGENGDATWIQINDQVSCQINSTTKPPFVGTPYPGDQKLGGGDPDGKKDTSKNADAKWVRCEFDLNPYKEEKNFTLKFKFASYYEGPIKGVGKSRPGRYYISDVYFKASEE